MKHKIVNILKIISLPFFCLISSCSNDRKAPSSTTNEHKIELDFNHPVVLSSMVKKNESDLFIIHTDFDCSFQFMLTIDRNERKNNEEVVVERFEEREMKTLSNSYNYEYFHLSGSTIWWVTYFEFDFKKDTTLYINVRGINYLGGVNNDECDTYYCYFDFLECRNNEIQHLLNNSFPIAR